MPPNAVPLKQKKPVSADLVSRKPGPRVVSLRGLEQPLVPDNDYWIERPRRTVLPALFEFHPED